MVVGPLHEWIAFDLETTGLVAEIDRVVEIGAVRFDASGRELARFERLINPERPMSPAAQAIHGISDADWPAKPRRARSCPPSSPSSAIPRRPRCWLTTPRSTRGSSA